MDWFSIEGQELLISYLEMVWKWNLDVEKAFITCFRNPPTFQFPIYIPKTVGGKDLTEAGIQYYLLTSRSFKISSI